MIFRAIANISIILVHAGSLYITWRLGLKGEDFVKIMPSTISSGIASLIALNTALTRNRQASKKARIEAKATNDGWNLSLELYIHNRYSTHLQIDDISIQHFSREENFEYPSVPAWDGAEFIVHFRSLSEHAAGASLPREMINGRALRASVTYRYIGSSKPKRIGVKFKNPFFEK